MKMPGCSRSTISPRCAWSSYDSRQSSSCADYTHRGDIVDLLHPGIFMRRETLMRLGGYQAPLGAADDIELWDRLADTAPIFVQTEYLMECLIDANSEAASFLETVHQKHLWAEECRHAWRAGNPEPTWEQFLWRQGPSRVRSA